MAYSVVSKKTGKTYYLHSKEVTLKGGRKQTIYYFAGQAKTGAMNALPPGYVVMENDRTGLPMLKKG
jgi:YHS domain-containing protein